MASPKKPPALDRLLQLDPYLNDHQHEICRRYGEFEVRTPTRHAILNPIKLNSRDVQRRGLFDLDFALANLQLRQGNPIPSLIKKALQYQLGLIERDCGGIDEFSRSFEKYGLHAAPDGTLTGLEWCPGADRLTLMGDFSSTFLPSPQSPK